MNFRFGSLRDAAARTRSALMGRVETALGRSELDAEAGDELEAALITADLGGETTDTVVENLRARQRRGEVRDMTALREALAEELLELLGGEQAAEPLLPDDLVLVLVVGFNGAGKTTSVAKLGKHWQEAGRTGLLVGGDTYRAAGSDQLSIWAERLNLPCIAGQRGGDAGALVFDAVGSARARGLDLILM